MRHVAPILALAGLVPAPAALAQLAPGQVLVVYDARIADSRDVAEYYAGSGKVPGGAGSLAGVHPGVRVLDLATLGAAQLSAGSIPYSQFKSKLRDPLRAYLASSGLAGVVRCIVLTKGLAHRIDDLNNGGVGDNPANFVTQFNNANVTCASVDSELALLWQDLDATEANGPADSKADGFILNPYWKSSQSIGMYQTGNITQPKTFTAVNTLGPVWSTAIASTLPPQLRPGDMYLVCRLDAPAVANVRAMIDRAQHVVVNVATAAILLDKDPAGFDGDSSIPTLNAGVDYDQTRDLLTTDHRFLVAPGPTAPGPGINYNNAAGVGNFYVGPNLAFTAGNGVLVTQPVLLLASYGSNHNGVPLLASGASSNTSYATSFTFAPGAIFNTIESYNGRDFGGLGQDPWVPQQQASAFLASGGTFALGNVWEPLASSIPDNVYIAQNFVLGGLSWGEAAWSSIPTLSWMQIVLGDPLARMDRSVEDINADSRVDVDDLYAWETLPAGSTTRDINRNGVMNSADRALLLKTLRQGERNSLCGPRP